MSERGEISLIGLLVAMTVFMGVLGATLTTFEAFDSQAQNITRRTDVQDAARQGADRVARDLRNLAGPNQSLPEAVDLAAPTDLVFNVVDGVKPATSANKSNVKRVRYCLDPATRVVWQQQQRWLTASRPAMPAVSGCPAGGAWSAATEVVGNVTNGARAVFTYDSAVTTSISSVGVDLFVDDDPRTGPPETRITTGVFLRNQNRLPRARFSATATATGVLLNGSASTDLEGQPLKYEWYDAGVKIGEGITFFFATPAGGSHTFSLVVSDPAGLSATSTTPEGTT